MLEFLREYQLNIMLILIGVCGLLAFLVLLTRALPLKRRFILMSMELCATFLLVADRYCYLYRGNISELGFYMVRICNFLVYFLTLLIIVIFNLYLGNLLLNEAGLKTLPKRMRVAHVLAAVDTVILVIGAISGWFYIFDESNRYQRQPGFFISYIIPLTIHQNLAFAGVNKLAALRGSLGIHIFGNDCELGHVKAMLLADFLNLLGVAHERGVNHAQFHGGVNSLDGVRIIGVGCY